MVTEFRRVLWRTVDERRSPPSQDVEAGYIHTGSPGDDAAVVADATLAIEHRDVEP